MPPWRSFLAVQRLSPVYPPGDDGDLRWPCSDRASPEISSCLLGQGPGEPLGRSEGSGNPPSVVCRDHFWLFFSSPALGCLLPFRSKGVSLRAEFPDPFVEGPSGSLSTYSLFPKTGACSP